MTRLGFTFASCLLFTVLGPLVALLTYFSLLTADRQATYLQGGGTLFFVGYAYAYGALQAVLHGALTAAGLLGIERAWRAEFKDRSLLRRLLASQVVGLTIVLLLQGAPLVLRGKNVLVGGGGLLTSVAKLWEFERGGTILIGLLPFVAWYLLPTLVCAALVGWFVLPMLNRQPASQPRT